LRVSVDISSTAEERVVNLYKAKDLPYIHFYHEGSLLMGFELRNWTSQKDLLFLERARLFSFNSFQTDFLFREKEIDVTRKIFDQTDDSAICSPIKVFISGDRSSVGKSTICLSILAVLIHAFKIPSHQLAYIKPVTQCEAEQPVTKFCQKYNIEHVGIGPVVFYSGFTRAYLGGETDSSQEMLANVEAAVTKLGANKRFVLIDGVGYPSVGSICNISNAHVAAQLKVPVVLVGKNGVGDAVDSYNINATYFESFGVRVLGGVFNKLDLSGFYSLELCKEAVSSYFSQFKGHQVPYGFIPKIDQILSELSLNRSVRFCR
jgi:dethiobiotin synthetase